MLDLPSGREHVQLHINFGGSGFTSQDVWNFEGNGLAINLRKTLVIYSYTKGVEYMKKWRNVVNMYSDEWIEWLRGIVRLILIENG